MYFYESSLLFGIYITECEFINVSKKIPINSVFFKKVNDGYIIHGNAYPTIITLEKKKYDVDLCQVVNRLDIEKILTLSTVKNNLINYQMFNSLLSNLKKQELTTDDVDSSDKIRNIQSNIQKYREFFELINIKELGELINNENLLKSKYSPNFIMNEYSESKNKISPIIDNLLEIGVKCDYGIFIRGYFI